MDCCHCKPVPADSKAFYLQMNYYVNLHVFRMVHQHKTLFILQIVKQELLILKHSPWI